MQYNRASIDSYDVHLQRSEIDFDGDVLLSTDLSYPDSSTYLGSHSALWQRCLSYPLETYNHLDHEQVSRELQATLS